MQFTLVIFGWCAVITSALLILVPYVRKRRDLINSWTLFQVGCANFMGISAIQTGNSLMHAYGTPQSQDYVKFVLGGVVFYFVSAMAYTYLHWPTRLANRVLTKWAPRSPKVMVWLIPLCIVLTAGFVFVPNIQFLGQWMIFLGTYASMFAIAFCFVAWAQRPWSVWLGVLSGMCFLIAVVVNNMGLGRRDFLSAMATVPLCWYWLRSRYYSPARVLMTVGVFAILGAIALAGVSIVRFAKQNPDLSVIQAAWEKVKSIPRAFSEEGNTESLFGGDTVDASLAAIRLYDRTKPIEPFFTIKYVLVHPIPRAWWPNKPEALGYTLPIEIGWSSVHGTINLGPGIVGHGYQEGGLWMLVFYGVFFAVCMRFFDTLLERDPSNPYLLGMLGSVSGQVIAFARGDIGLFCVLILGGIITGFVLNWIARMFFGTEHLTISGNTALIDSTLPVDAALPTSDGYAMVHPTETPWNPQ